MAPLPFRLTWLLVDELAIGTAPSQPSHLDDLAEQGVAAVLSLCAAHEAPAPVGLCGRFRLARVVLPDHHSPECLEPEALHQAVASLAILRAQGPVFMHCVAAVERSPLVAIAWLMRTRGMALENALSYLQATHPGTSPLPRQLEALRTWQRLYGSHPLRSEPIVAA
jgi:hypothetical protein